LAGWTGLEGFLPESFKNFEASWLTMNLGGDSIPPLADGATSEVAPQAGNSVRLWT